MNDHLYSGRFLLFIFLLMNECTFPTLKETARMSLSLYLLLINTIRSFHTFCFFWMIELTIISKNQNKYSISSLHFKHNLHMTTMNLTLCGAVLKTETNLSSLFLYNKVKLLDHHKLDTPALCLSSHLEVVQHCVRSRSDSRSSIHEA